MSRKDRILAILSDALEPHRLDVNDISHRHAGHAGARPEGETHYTILIAAQSLRGLSRVAQHRKINQLLKVEFDQGLHALQINVVDG